MAMHCPKCNRNVRRTEDVRKLAYCVHCGWRQRSRASAGEAQAATDGGMVVVKLLVAWLFSLALIIGPYVALLIYVPDAPLWIHLVYWVVMFIYLAAAATTSPRVDTSNLGLAGGMIDNPFTWEDDVNRAGLTIAIALIPGKVVAWAIRTTWQTARGR